MRPNTQAIISHPTFRAFNAANGNGQWSMMKFPSIRAMLAFINDHANTSNESGWHDAAWAGLEEQTLTDFYASGKSPAAQRLMDKAKAKMPAKTTRLAEPRMAVAGGYWDTPSVLANLPLSARTRKRSKLAPLNLRIAFVLSAGINAQDLAPITARIVRAVWDYILAGGIVNLSVIDVGTISRDDTPNQSKGFAIEAKVNTSDVAELSLALHPAFSRLCGGPLQTAFSTRNQNTSIGVPSKNPIADAHWIGGPIRKVIENAEQVIKLLAIN